MHGLTKVAPLPGAGRRALPEQREADDDREIRFLGDLQRLRPEPGDVFALTVDADISTDQAERIRESWKRVMGDIPVIVLTPGVRLEWFESSALPLAQPKIHVGAHHIGITK